MELAKNCAMRGRADFLLLQVNGVIVRMQAHDFLSVVTFVIVIRVFLHQ